MLNIHLNGDIVRCPDIAAIKKRIFEQKDHKRICRYNVLEDSCKAWQNSLRAWQNTKNNFDCERCMLSGSLQCPGHLKQKESGNKKKTYRIDNTKYRMLSSATHDLVKTSKYKTLFLTLTFPKFKIKPDEKQINQCFSKFVENLRDTYHCTGYIAVRENGGRNNRIHFHIVCGLPYTDFVILNNAWCHAISGICEYSKNAIRTTKETLFIKNPVRALRYVCKYFAKARGSVSDTRLIFMSNNLVKIPIKVYGSIESILEGYKGIYINRTSEYTTCFRITNPDEFNRFCENYLYNAFNQFYNFPVFNKNPIDFYSPGSG